MHNYTEYFPVRSTQDNLDVVPLLLEGLLKNGPHTLMEFNGEKTSFAAMAQRVGAIQG